MFFSVCAGPTGGRISIGDNDTAQHTGPVYYVPTVSNSYQLIIAKTLIGNAVVNVSDEYAYVHFGPFDTTFSPKMYSQIRSTFQQFGDTLEFLSDDGNLFDGACVKLSPNSVSQYPIINFSFATSTSRNPSTFVNISFMPNFYMRNSDDGSCVQLAFRQANDTVIGISFTRQYSITYDRHSECIGFSVANTDVCGGVWQTGIAFTSEELMMNLVILGSIFGFMLLSLLAYWGLSTLCCKQQARPYERVK